MKTRYEISKIKATPFGGLYAFTEFLSQIKFYKTFHDCFKKLRKVRQSTPSQNIALLVGMILEGGERLYDINRFAKDQTVCELFDVPSAPKDTTLRDDLFLIGQKDEERAELLFCLNKQLFDKLQLKSITIDLDATALPVDGHQEGAEKGYCPEEPGSRCFQSVKAICDETETVLAEWTMSGNAHCSRDVAEHLKPLLDRLAKKGTKVKMRLDTGFYSAELLLLFESYSNVTYIIGVPQHDWLQAKVKALSYKSYYGSQRDYTTFAYAEGFGGAFRHYSVERSTKPADSQMDLFDQDAYSYRVIVSNEACKPHLIFRSYNRRGRAEKHIEEQKNAYALGKMVSNSFTISKALFWLSHLAFTLMGMLRQVAFRATMKKYRLRRLRFILFSAMGWFVTHAKKRIFKLALPRNGPLPFDAMMQRIWAF